MMKIIGEWNITYLDTMVTSTIVFTLDGEFRECKTNLEGIFNLDGNNLTLEFPSIQLPGENNAVPLRLEACLTENQNKFKGSIYNMAYQGGRMMVLGEKVAMSNKQSIERLVMGDWRITYHDTSTNSCFTIYPDKTFYQRKGNYYGKWFVSDDNKLILTFNDITLSDRHGPLMLEANVTESLFYGEKEHPSYKNEKLVFEATREVYNNVS